MARPSLEQRAKVALKAADPLGDTEAPSLERLCHPLTMMAVAKFSHLTTSTLSRRQDDIGVPTWNQIAPLVRACSGGHNETWDQSPDWQHWFGTKAELVQNATRGLWRSVNELQTPAPDAFASALSAHVVELFKAARERQVQRAEKAARAGVSAAQAAAQLIEATGPFTSALDAYAATNANIGHSGLVPQLRDGLERLSRVCRGELAA